MKRVKEKKKEVEYFFFFVYLEGVLGGSSLEENPVCFCAQGV